MHISSPLHSTFMLEPYLAAGRSDVQKKQKFDAVARGGKNSRKLFSRISI